VEPKYPTVKKSGGWEICPNVVGGAHLATTRTRSGRSASPSANLGALSCRAAALHRAEAARLRGRHARPLMTGVLPPTPSFARTSRGPFLATRELEPVSWAQKMSRTHFDKIAHTYGSGEMYTAAGGVDLGRGHHARSRTHGFRNGRPRLLGVLTGHDRFMRLRHSRSSRNLALVNYKRLVGGGMSKMSTHDHSMLEHFAYMRRFESMSDPCEYIDTEENIEGAPCLKDEHLRGVRRARFRASYGTRSI